MLKTKVIIIKIHDVPVCATVLKEMSAQEFADLKKECEKNLVEIERHELSKIETLTKKVQELEHEVKILKGEE